MRKALMIAYKFPPLDSSAVARPLYFSRFLRDHGYHPIVLTADPTGRGNLSPELLEQLEGRCEIHRLRARNLREMFGARPSDKAAPVRLPSAGEAPAASGMASFLKRSRLAITRNIPWVWPAIAAGLKIHLRGGFEIIWATCDPLSSLIVGYWLSRLTGKPLIADIRDPITYGTEWARRDPQSSKYITRWEQTVLHAAARTVYTSPLTTQIMQQRVRPAAAGRMVTITNGFLAPDVEPEPKRDVGPDKCVFTHLGIVAAHRNPDILLQAFDMACNSPGVGDDLRFQFIGDVRDYDLLGAIERMGLADRVKYLGFVPHEDTRRYVRGTDVLVMLQPWAGPGCDIVCGKDFEYLAARRPILGVAPPGGGDAWLINDADAGIVTGVDSAERVADAMVKYWRLWKDGKLDQAAPTGDINRFERRSLTKRLAALFDDVLQERSAGSPRPH